MRSGVMVVSVLILGGCMNPDRVTGGPGSANPASEYCISLGGRLEVRHEAGGQLGYCHLQDGRIVEEWALFGAQ